MNITELCKFIQESGFEIAIMPDPQTGGFKMVARKWYGKNNQELVMDVNHFTPEFMDNIEEQVQIFVNRLNRRLEENNIS